MVKGGKQYMKNNAVFPIKAEKFEQNVECLGETEMFQQAEDKQLSLGWEKLHRRIFGARTDRVEE